MSDVTVRAQGPTHRTDVRYELIDGMLVVCPVPGRRHQKVLLRLGAALDAVCPPDLDVAIAPFAVRPSTTTELQPDVLVGREEDFTENMLPVAPVLAVEVLSPTSVINDFNNKKAAYQRLGVENYWVIDPEEATLTAFELDDAGVYRRTAEVKGADAFETGRPFPVRIVPVELLGRLAHKD